MLKIIVSQWEEHQDELRRELFKRKDLNDIEYKDLVKLTFEIIYNNCLPESQYALDLDKIHEINDGDYQGTLLFLIPFDSCQPCEFEYLMTYVGYGSCSWCDTLLSIQGCSGDVPTESQVNDFMKLCKDILTNTIKPFNGGWRETVLFEQIQVEENK